MFGFTTVENTTTPVPMTADASTDAKPEFKRLIFPNPNTYVFPDGHYDTVYRSGRWFVGEMSNNTFHKGRLTQLSGDFLEGDFNDSGYLIKGISSYNGIVYEGTFNGCRCATLNGENCKVTYKSGIIFEGTVVDNRPQYGKGTFTVPTGVKATFRDHAEHTGTVSMNGDRFVITFTEGPFRTVTSNCYSLMNNWIDIGDIHATFQDGSVINLDRPCLFGSTKRTFILSSHHTFNTWQPLQLIYWLNTNRELEHIPEEFFSEVEDNRVDSPILLEFTNEMYERYGLDDPVHRIQIRREIEKMNKSSY